MNFLHNVFLHILILFVALFTLGRYGPVAHFINAVDRLLAAPFVAACGGLHDAIDYLTHQIDSALTHWMTWPQPVQTNTRQTDSTTDAADPAQQTQHPPVGSAPWPVWDLIATGPLVLMLWLMIAADVIFAGLRATAILGLPYLDVPPTPLIFGLSAPAIGFALAPIIAFAVFAMAILDSRGASPYGSRPWGNLRPDDRARLTHWCTVGLGVSMIALILFAIFGAVVLAGSEEALPADDAQSLQALLRVGLFIVYVPVVAGAAALLWWTNWASLAAAYILLLVAVRLVLVVLRPASHFVAHFIDRIDEVLVQLLRLISSPLIALWNTFCSGREVGGRSLPEVRVCERRPVNDGCVDWKGNPDAAYTCYCARRDRPFDREAQQQVPIHRVLSPSGVGSDGQGSPAAAS